MYGISEATRDARAHMLTRTEETRLHGAYLAGDHVAGRRLVTSFLPALRKVTYDPEMLGVAVQAFMENLSYYDPRKGTRLWSYMRVVVRNALAAHGAAHNAFFKLTAPKDKTAIAHLEREKKRLGASGRPLTGSEARRLADVFGVPECVVHGIDENMSILRPTPLQNDRQGEMHGVDDPERAGGHLDFERRHDQAIHMERLTAGLALLDARQRVILERRFKEEPDTLQQLSDDMGVSRERIRQIEAMALRTLRHAIDRPEADRKTDATLRRHYRGRRHDCPTSASRAGAPRSSDGRKVTRKGTRMPARRSGRRATAPARKAAEAARQAGGSSCCMHGEG